MAGARLMEGTGGCRARTTAGEVRWREELCKRTRGNAPGCPADKISGDRMMLPAMVTVSSGRCHWSITWKSTKTLLDYKYFSRLVPYI